MVKNLFFQYMDSFFEILFLRFYSSKIKEFNILNRTILYTLSISLFYIPIIYGVIALIIHNYEYIPYFVLIIVLHIISKAIRINTQKVQQRFSTIKTKKLFFHRFILVTEYVALMWIVYLIYPISCILLPFSMILFFYEKLFGFQFFFNIVVNHTEQFIFYGSFISYFIFIYFDSYKKLLKGSLPSYLGLYALLTAISSFIDESIEVYIPDIIQVHLSTFSSILSYMFSLSNHSLKIVSSVVMFISAICSIYATCGLDQKSLEQAKDASKTNDNLV